MHQHFVSCMLKWGPIFFKYQMGGTRKAQTSAGWARAPPTPPPPPPAHSYATVSSLTTQRTELNISQIFLYSDIIRMESYPIA